MKQVDSMLLSICPVVGQRRCQNVVRTRVTHSPKGLLCHFFVLNIFWDYCLWSMVSICYSICCRFFALPFSAIFLPKWVITRIKSIHAQSRIYKNVNYYLSEDGNNKKEVVFVTFSCIFLIVCFQSCQADLVKDNGHKYFLSVLADAYMRVSQIQLCTQYIIIFRPLFQPYYWTKLVNANNFVLILISTTPLHVIHGICFLFFRLSSVQWQHLCYQSLWMNIQLVKWVQKFIFIRKLCETNKHTVEITRICEITEEGDQSCLMQWLLASFCL